MRSNMKPIDLLLKQPEDVMDVDELFARSIETFSEFQIQRRQKLQRAFLDARPLSHNAYKTQVGQAIVRETLHAVTR